MSEEQNTVQEQISPFWSGIVSPGADFDVEFPEDFELTLTSVCLGDLPENFETKPVRLFADVTTLEMDEEAAKDEENIKTHKNKLLIATLIPGEKEFQQVNFTFNELNKVVLTVQGAYPVHIVGEIQAIDQEEEDFCEEECDHEHEHEHEEEK